VYSKVNKALFISKLAMFLRDNNPEKTLLGKNRGHFKTLQPYFCMFASSPFRSIALSVLV
jgi:hypothetical protein